MKIGSTEISNIKIGSTSINRVIKDGVIYWEVTTTTISPTTTTAPTTTIVHTTTSSWTPQAETTAYIAGLATPLSDTQLRTLDTAIKETKIVFGITALDEWFDYLYDFSDEQAPASLRNLVGSSFTATLQGSPAFVPNEGYTSSSNSTYIKTNYKSLTNHVRFNQDDGGEGVYIRSQIENLLKIPFGAVKTAGGNNFDNLVPKYTGKFSFALNAAATTSETKNFTNDAGWYVMFRDSATAVRGYINTIKKVDITSNSVALNDLIDWIGCRNLDGAANGYANYQIAMKFKSRSMTEVQYLGFVKAWDKYFRAKNKSVLSYLEAQNNHNNPAKMDVFVYPTDFSATGDRFRIPAIIRGSGNNLICTAEGRWGASSDYQRSHIVMKLSPDNGVTWGTGQVLMNNNGVFTNYDHGSRVVNATPVKVGNRIFVFMTKIDDATATIYYGVTLGAPTFYQYFGYVYSDDDGATWSAFVDLTALSDAETNVLSASPSCGGIVLTNGTICLPILSHRHSANTADAGTDWGIRAGIVYSTDGGANWSIGGLIPTFSDETTIVEYETNKIMAISRSAADNFRVFTTPDLGANWTAHANDKLIEGTNCEITSHKYVYNGVTKFLLIRPLTDTPLRGDVRIRISDDCITFKNLIQLWAGQSNGYTGMCSDSDGNLFATLETGTDIVMWNFSNLKDDIIR